jgi:hypothetical protein
MRIVREEVPEITNILYSLIRHGPHRNDPSNNFYVVACVLISTVIFLASRCLATRGYTHTGTQIYEMDLRSMPLRWTRVLYIPSFIKNGSAI